MNDDPALYGDRIADVYDDLYPALADDAPAIERIVEWARGGRVLELGIGSGRFALPLARRGVAIEGVDVSEKMVALLRAKPGGDRIPVVLGTFPDAMPRGPYALVFVAFSTLFGLTSQEEQVRCFAEVARRLSPGGAFAVEAFVPDPSRFDRGQRVNAIRLRDDETLLDVSQHDAARQRIDAHHLRLREDGTKIMPVHLRYAWPSELDLMARLAALSLRERFGGWNRERYTGAGIHVSVYAKSA